MKLEQALKHLKRVKRNYKGTEQINRNLSNLILLFEHEIKHGDRT